MRILKLPLLVAAVALAMQLPDVANAQSNDCHTAPLIDPNANITFYTTPSTTYPCMDDSSQKCMVWKIRSSTPFRFSVTSCGFMADSSMAIRTNCGTGHFGDSPYLQWNNNIGVGCAPAYGASAVDLDIIADTDYFFSLGGPSSLPATGAFGKEYTCPAGSTDHDGLSDTVKHYATPCVTCSPGQYVPAASVGPCTNFRCAVGTVDHDSDPSTPCLVAGPGNDTTIAGLYGPIANFKVVAGRYDDDSNPSTASIACPAGNYAPVGSTTCTACAAGTWDDDGTSATACTNCTECTLGSTFETIACAATVNRVCSNCVTCTQGHYPNTECTLTSTATACDACTPITNCSATGLTCVSSASQQCSLCQDGSYVSVQGTCELCTICGSDTYETRACDGVVNRVCASCTTCGSDQFETGACGGTINRVCSNCTSCGLDQYETAACGGTTNRVCANCTNCDSTQYETTACAGVVNRVCSACTVCGANEFETTACDALVNRECSTCTTCTVGQYEGADCMATTNRVCPACSELPGCTTGLRCTNSTDSICIDCSSCPRGQYVNATCTNVLDRVCHNCTALPGCPASYTVCSAYGHSTCVAPETSTSMPVYIPVVAAVGGLLVLVLLVVFLLSRRRTRKPATAVEIPIEEITMMTINTMVLDPKEHRASQYETLNGTRGGGNAVVYDVLGRSQWEDPQAAVVPSRSLKPSLATSAPETHYAVPSQPKDDMVPSRSLKPVLAGDAGPTSHYQTVPPRPAKRESEIVYTNADFS
ncbi:hypothetical protein CAOG_03019 [Capsaspora owczarzaki ATCC 30864]|nr:hypothetical protein CAOG_03019 [Capsaspora owczarzaki ATCC 30864]|eukprot:XP_004363858.2 hypothetical protein CAOG_03019 [Capsaspora owczarzaki ATCC 30864]